MSVGGVVARWDRAQRYTLISRPAVSHNHLMADPARLDDITADLYMAIHERIRERMDKCFSSGDTSTEREGFRWHRALELLDAWAAHAEAYDPVPAMYRGRLWWDAWREAWWAQGSNLRHSSQLTGKIDVTNSVEALIAEREAELYLDAVLEEELDLDAGEIDSFDAVPAGRRPHERFPFAVVAVNSLTVNMLPLTVWKVEDDDMLASASPIQVTSVIRHARPDFDIPPTD